MAKEKEKKKIKPLAPEPTITPIDASLNKAYIQPRGALKSNIVVSQEDLMPSPPQARQTLQVRGALAPPKPTTPPKPVGTIASPIGLPSMEQQLRTATTTFKPAVKPTAVSPEIDRLQKMAEANKAAGKISTAGMSKADYIAYAKIKQAEAKQEDEARDKGIVEKTGQFLGQFYTPGAGLGAITAGTQAAGSLLSRVAPSIGRGTGLGAAATREAIKETAVGIPLAAGQALAQEPGISGRELAKQTALGAGLGAVAGGALAGLGKGIGAIYNRLKRNNVPDEAIQEILALPAPRQRGRVSTVSTPDVMPGFGGGRLPELPAPGPLGLPAPSIAEPTTGRIAQQVNPYRQQFETLMQRAQQLQQEGRFTPGREDADLESLWTQMAGREGVSLDELIQRAYPTRTSRVSPDLVQSARARQAAREVAGAPLPVRSTAERLTQQQGVLGRAATPLERVGRASQAPKMETSTSQPVRPRTEVSPEFISPQPQVARTPITNRGGLQRQTEERAFFSNLEQGDLTPEMRAQLSESTARGYKPITNLGTIEKANKRIAKGIDEAEAKLINKTKIDAEDLTTGMRLIQELQSSGNVMRAVTIAEKLAKKLTEAGQLMQAASIWKRLSPEGVLMAAQRKINTVNENLLRGQTPVKMTEKQANDITETAGIMQAAGASQERAQQVMDIMNRERSGGNITGDERKFVSDFIKDAKSFLRKTDETKPPVEATHPPEIRNPIIRKRVISYLDSAEQAARERIRARGNQLSSTPLDIWADYAIIGASKMVKGALKFSVWSESMVRDFGESVRPQLRQIYEKSKETLKAESLRISQQKITSAEKVAESWLNRNEARLFPEDITAIQTLAQDVSNLSSTEQRLASQDLQAIIQSFEKAGIGQKASALQYIMMLLNPLTQIRNVVGNELMYRLERVQRVISTPIDIATSKLTGSNRTVTFKRGPSVFESYFQPTRDFFGNLGEGFSAGWRGVNPEGLQSKYELMGQAFKSKYNPLTYMEKALGAVMQGFDYAAYKRATNGRLAETAYLDALNRGITGDDAIKSHMMTIMSNMDDQIHSIASEYGKFATLQNESQLATALTTGRRLVNKISTMGRSEKFGAGSVVLPFAKTPANLLMRSIDYSPLGILKAMNQTYSILRDPLTDLTRADVIESVSRAAIGTGIGAFAYWLADKGALWGKSDKDPEVRKLMTASGQTDFQMNGTAIRRMIEAAISGGDVDKAAKKQPGDTFWAYSWAAPTATPIAIGASVWKGLKEEESGANIAATSALSAANTLLDSSVLSSLTEVFRQQPGSDNPFGSILMNLVKQVPGQFVPSLARQINTLTDPTVKETYAMKDDLLGQITNYAESAVPGLSQQLPQRVSTLGKPQERLNTFADIFLSPAARNKYKPTPEAQMVIDLIEETGDNKIAPRAVAKYIEGINLTTKEKERIDLTPEEYVRLQTFVGQETEAMLKRVNEGWSTERKVEFIIDGLNAAGAKGRNMMKKEFGLQITR